MGYTRHHAIVVTGMTESVIQAHAKATEIFSQPYDEVWDSPVSYVTEITPEGTNGYRSFMVAPDGSKEWWPHSDAGDAARTQFIEWLEEDRGTHWVEVQFADDDDINKVCRNS